eukprot:6088395-Pleurochrysis_carterae.AAC.1
MPPHSNKRANAPFCCLRANRRDAVAVAFACAAITPRTPSPAPVAPSAHRAFSPATTSRAKSSFAPFFARAEPSPAPPYLPTHSPQCIRIHGWLCTSRSGSRSRVSLRRSFVIRSRASADTCGGKR